MLPDLHTGFSRGRSGSLVFPSLSEFGWTERGAYAHGLGVWIQRVAPTTQEGTHGGRSRLRGRAVLRGGPGELPSRTRGAARRVLVQQGMWSGASLECSTCPVTWEQMSEFWENFRDHPFPGRLGQEAGPQQTPKGSPQSCCLRKSIRAFVLLMLFLSQKSTLIGCREQRGLSDYMGLEKRFHHVVLGASHRQRSLVGYSP